MECEQIALTGEPETVAEELRQLIPAAATVSETVAEIIAQVRGHGDAAVVDYTRRFDIVGGGPSGLYFALLMKKVDRANEVTVWERNAPDATFGWGVVFSEETLGALRDADPESFLEITESFASWGSIDVHYGGEMVRSRGHRFSGIARTALLASEPSPSTRTAG